MGGSPTRVTEEILQRVHVGLVERLIFMLPMLTLLFPMISVSVGVLQETGPRAE